MIQQELAKLFLQLHPNATKVGYTEQGTGLLKATFGYDIESMIIGNYNGRYEWSFAFHLNFVLVHHNIKGGNRILHLDYSDPSLIQKLTEYKSLYDK